MKKMTLNELKSLPDGIKVDAGCKYADGWVDWYDEYVKTPDGLYSPWAEKTIHWVEVGALLKKPSTIMKLAIASY